MYRVSSFVQHFAWALIAGCIVASVWVNLDPGSYFDLIEWRVLDRTGYLPSWSWALTPQNLVSTLLMPLFLFYLAKELWEAICLERGALRNGRGGLPLMGAAGGLIGAALAYILAAALFQNAEDVTMLTGWTVPLASDVVLGYLFARMVFGPGSPAVHVFLLMTIAMDIAALLLFALFCSDWGFHSLWLLLSAAAVIAAWSVAGRHLHAGATERARRRALQLWPYVLAGIVCWIGVTAAGLPPALGLLPILPVIPHADRSFGMFAEAEEFLSDPLNRLTQRLVWPLVIIMGLFGLTHGALDLQALAPMTGILLIALWFGKPFGVAFGALLLAPRLGFRLPQGMRRRHIVLIAGLSGIGFTLPVLSLGQALPGGFLQEAARLGLGLSLLAGLVAVLISRAVGQVRRA